MNDQELPFESIVVAGALECLNAIEEDTDAQIVRGLVKMAKVRLQLVVGEITIPTSPVNSKNIARIGFIEAAEVLAVTFTGGESYLYAEFPKELYLAFLRSTSKGKFFHSEIKDKYTFVQV
jgi:hypothetical protein